MKIVFIRSLLLLASTLAVFTALAHDPADHRQKNDKPNCAGINHNQMDINDPVAQAIMEQCSMAQADVKNDADKHTEHGSMHKTDKTKKTKKTMNIEHENHGNKHHH